VCMVPTAETEPINENFNLNPEYALPPVEEGFVLFGIQLHPRSIGYIRLASANPFDYPVIEPNYFGAPEDYESAVQILKFLGKVSQSPALKENYTGDISNDTIGKGFVPFTDQYYEHAARTISAFTSYHPIGTCKMGAASDPLAVVDPHLKVKGVTNLRVVDASIIPLQTSGNTQVPVFMIGEKASHMIKAEWGLKN